MVERVVLCYQTLVVLVVVVRGLWAITQLQHRVVLVGLVLLLQ
jgi:hypothetical protein